MEIDEVLESPGFYILAGLGIGAELVGWIYGRKMMDISMPIWQLIVLIIGTLIASAVFASRD